MHPVLASDMRRVTFVVAAASPIAGVAAELLQLLLSLSSSRDISSKAKLLASAELSSSCEELRSKVSKLCLVTLIPQWLEVTSALVRHRLQLEDWTAHRH